MERPMPDDSPHVPDPFAGRAGTDRDRLPFELAFATGVPYSVTDGKPYGAEFARERDRVIGMAYGSFPDVPAKPSPSAG